ncbi:pre-mRNA-splicing factor 38B [Drosophila montana]|uniref:pre-mRNA-splicing factor 38B n=1 Tax=Drosophila montana TaxID=40370 RepID=UPI00313D678F
MDDPALTSQAIAELMRELPSNNGKASYEPQERKINPLGKPNKKFLGRTINTALRHNKRAIERTQARCQQKLQELDDRYERRKTNAFYNRKKPKEESYGRRERKSRSRKKVRKRHKSRSSSRESRSRSRSHKKKHKKKHSKFKRRQRRRRSTSSSGVSPPAKTADDLTVPRSEYYVHSNNLALAVAMAYSQTLFAHQTLANKPHSPASQSSDIIRELMSDEETMEQDIQLDTLSIASSSEEVPEIVTIDVSSQDEQSVGSSVTDSESDASNCSSIALVDSGSDELASNSGSDIEIIECDIEPKEEQNQLPVESTQQAEPEEALSAADIATTVDLTDD